MKLADFYTRVEEDPELRGVAITTETDRATRRALVEEIRTACHTSLPFEAIATHDWEMIRDIILGTRSPVLLHHVTRIVGYFSRIENWNRSKLGELHDRRAGTYSLQEQPAERVQHQVA